MSNNSSGEGGRSRDLSSGINHISTPSDHHETPSSTLADISLVPTRRRSRGADYDDPHDHHDTPASSAAKVISIPSSAVMVTTTIERETRPFSYKYTESPVESSKTCGCGCLISLKAGMVDGRLLTAQTKITAGGSHFLEDFDQKLDPCCCQTFPLREIPSVT
ncbi:hypothetical protein TARUN_5365 [Trichoderma arundinaceum]|uniref:Uncharacterized protein n=1 Tax=Trichoderma arundinaceum TaxID=490622 RepID=A0A395NLA7_TRIAR|nr:hypothetical protein TARUN_5365 [Trichoderma arundinaceum]